MVKDCIEILFFTSLIYYCMRWLNKDRQKSLILYFYCYCFLMFGSYIFSLSSMSVFLVHCFPVIFTLFIIVHQELLQRNFIALHAISAKTTEQSATAWPEMLMRSVLTLLHKQQEIVCVIEQQQSLSSFINAPFMLHAPLQQGMLEALLEGKFSQETNSFVWMNNHGIIQSIESSWIPHEKIVENQHERAQEWLQEALLFTSKTDALILKATVASRTFTCITQGRLREGLTADHMVRILQGVKSHVQSTQKHRSQQPAA